MNLTRISRTLSFMLRHSTSPQYVRADGGWAKVTDILTALRKRYPDVDREVLDAIVAQDEKGRYSYSPDGTMIRANQGHSIPNVVVEMEAVADPPALLYHGTSTRAIGSILHEGLTPQHRHFVHISNDRETAVKTGRRHGKPVVLTIDAKRFVADGNELYLSSNGVWQAKHVPPEYFTDVEYTE